jgi:anti-sigma regulatory factor (Ser/Thr protein kinase)
MHSTDAKSRAGPKFRHSALLYRGQQGFLEGALPFIRQGIEAGEPALVMVSAQKIALLRAALGGETHGVQFADMDQVGSNPARIIPAWRRFVDEYPCDGRTLRGIGEPICTTFTAPELVECQRHEALLNLAFADGGEFDLLCPYNTDTLDPEVIAEAERSHPLLLEGDRHRSSGCYRGLDAIAAPFDAPLPEPPSDALELQFRAETLQEVRAFIRWYGRDAGIDGETISHLLIGVSELASNSIRHGGGQGVAKLWRDDQVIVCEVRDHGRMNLPLAGRIHPPADDIAGRGLWLANQVCDLIQIRSLPDGTVVRAQVAIARRVFDGRARVASVAMPAEDPAREQADLAAAEAAETGDAKRTRPR